MKQRRCNTGICPESSNNHTIQIDNTIQVSQDACANCIAGVTGQPPPIGSCTTEFLESAGIIPTLNTVTNVLTLTLGQSLVAPGVTGVSFDLTRLSNSQAQFNSQLPTGGLRSYLSSVFSNVGSSTASNAKSTLGVMLFVIIFLIFLLYTIILIALMGHGTMTLAVGLTLIFIGLFFSAIAFLIAIDEVSRFGTNFANNISSETSPVLDNLVCAFTSALCCYSGGQCGCEDGTNKCGTACKNQGFPP